MFTNNACMRSEVDVCMGWMVLVQEVFSLVATACVMAFLRFTLAVPWTGDHAARAPIWMKWFLYFFFFASCKFSPVLKKSILTLQFLNIPSVLFCYLLVGACDSVYVGQLIRTGRVLVVAKYSKFFCSKIFSPALGSKRSPLMGTTCFTRG